MFPAPADAVTQTRSSIGKKLRRYRSKARMDRDAQDVIDIRNLVARSFRPLVTNVDRNRLRKSLTDSEREKVRRRIQIVRFIDRAECRDISICVRQCQEI